MFVRITKIPTLETEFYDIDAPISGGQRDPYDDVPYVPTRARTPEEKAEDKRRYDRQNRNLTAGCLLIFFFLPVFLISAFFAAALSSTFMGLVAVVLFICAAATFVWGWG